MGSRRSLTAVVVIGLAALVLVPMAPCTAAEGGVIRLKRPTRPAGEAPGPAAPNWQARRGFDYEAFERRLESLWFQRKAFLNDGREADAARQSDLIRSFCAEEGVRQSALASALLAETRRYVREGSYNKALASLDLTDALDPDRAQTHFARASVTWKSGGGHFSALGSWLAGVRRSLVEGWESLRIFDHLGILTVVSLLAVLVVFAFVMAFKYQNPFRHDVEEWITRLGAEPWARTAGWAALLLPLMAWVVAGWIAIYWIVATFRYMRRGERLVALSLLVSSALAVPAFRSSVALYGVLTDPAVRSTLDSAGREYSPERIVALNELVQSHPDDPVYRFLLAGLYQEGRYFEEAYAQYRQVLEIDPGSYQAHVNIGNIFYRFGQYPEAIAAYRTALELRPDSVLAYYNMYRAQSESFHFVDAEMSLKTAQKIDARLTASLLSAAREEGQRSAVRDASIGMGSVWRAALEGRPLGEMLREERTTAPLAALPRQMLNVLSIVSLLAAIGCCAVVLVPRHRPPARPCVRCGRAFCQLCRTLRQGEDYCTQCQHLFVLGDGLAPDSKTRKLYEIERFERNRRRVRNVLSVVVPGTGSLLRDRPVRGCIIAFAWILAILSWSPTILAPIERIGGIRLGLDLLRHSGVPAFYQGIHPLGLVAILVALTAWLTENRAALRGRGV